ncbi:MAG: type I-E CRISPR-associated protein Cse2/CasB [Methylocystis sp.]
MTSEKQRQGPDAPFKALQWWRGLTGQQDGRNETGKDRAARARLRRASPSEAICEEATLRLFAALDLPRRRLTRVATLACVLATIREDEPRPLGRALGREKIDNEQTAALSILRFKRLLDAESEEEIADAFRRAIAILRGKANVRDLAKIILDFEREGMKPRIVFDYYGAGERGNEQSDAKVETAA